MMMFLVLYRAMSGCEAVISDAVYRFLTRGAVIYDVVHRSWGREGVIHDAVYRSCTRGGVIYDAVYRSWARECVA